MGGLDSPLVSTSEPPPTTVHARVADTEIELHPFVAPIEVALLGRADFFHHFAVTFNEQARTFTLQPIERLPTGPQRG
jgi:hypothetical protein